MDEHLAKVIEAARDATCDTHNIPACVELGRALRAWDEARGAICKPCNGIGYPMGPDDESPGDSTDGKPCETCGGSGLVEPPLPMMRCEQLHLLLREVREHPASLPPDLQGRIDALLKV